MVQAILNLPEQVHIAVRYTGIKLIGELCEWLNKHPKFIGKHKFFCELFLRKQIENVK